MSERNRHSQLLAVPLSERCHATTPTERSACRALFADGWDWHGCDISPDDHTDHHCPCGHEWSTT